jgi:threonine dehydratase
MIDISNVRAAAEILRGHANRTPVVTSRGLDALAGATVHLKVEALQRTGSFKFRGAYHALSQLTEDQRRRGVVTGSSGNHAQAVALAASLWNSTAKVVMPLDAPAAKVAAAREYGAEVITFDRFSEDREAIGRRIAETEGRTQLFSFDHPHIMAGQGTVALELLEEVGELDFLLTPVGGGGLLSGCAAAAKGLSPAIRVVGVEPAAGDDVRRSLRLGERVSIPVPRTIADGLTATTPGVHTFEVIKRHVDDVVTVTDDEIVDAMRYAFERLKLVIEPSGALALAAVLCGRLPVEGKRVGVVLSGGNTGAERFVSLVGQQAREAA